MQRSEEERERLQNEAFEKANPGFCAGFQADMAKRNAEDARKARRAEELRVAGNAAFKAREWPRALHLYSEALTLAPLSEAVLTNLSAAHNSLAQAEAAAASTPAELASSVAASPAPVPASSLPSADAAADAAKHAALSLEYATRAAWLNPCSAKALWRRAQASLTLDAAAPTAAASAAAPATATGAQAAADDSAAAAALVGPLLSAGLLYTPEPAAAATAPAAASDRAVKVALGVIRPVDEKEEAAARRQRQRAALLLQAGWRDAGLDRLQSAVQAALPSGAGDAAAAGTAPVTGAPATAAPWSWLSQAEADLAAAASMPGAGPEVADALARVRVEAAERRKEAHLALTHGHQSGDSAAGAAAAVASASAADGVSKADSEAGATGAAGLGASAVAGSAAGSSEGIAPPAPDAFGLIDRLAAQAASVSAATASAATTAAGAAGSVSKPGAAPHVQPQQRLLPWASDDVRALAVALAAADSELPSSPHSAGAAGSTAASSTAPAAAAGAVSQADALAVRLRSCGGLRVLLDSLPATVAFLVRAKPAAGASSLLLHPGCVGPAFALLAGAVSANAKNRLLAVDGGLVQAACSLMAAAAHTMLQESAASTAAGAAQAGAGAGAVRGAGSQGNSTTPSPAPQSPLRGAISRLFDLPTARPASASHGAADAPVAAESPFLFHLYLPALVADVTGFLDVLARGGLSVRVRGAAGLAGDASSGASSAAAAAAAEADAEGSCARARVLMAAAPGLLSSLPAIVPAAAAATQTAAAAAASKSGAVAGGKAAAAGGGMGSAASVLPSAVEVVLECATAALQRYQQQVQEEAARAAAGAAHGTASRSGAGSKSKAGAGAAGAGEAEAPRFPGPLVDAAAGCAAIVQHLALDTAQPSVRAALATMRPAAALAGASAPTSASPLPQAAAAAAPQALAVAGPAFQQRGGLVQALLRFLSQLVAESGAAMLVAMRRASASPADFLAALLQLPGADAAAGATSSGAVAAAPGVAGGATRGVGKGAMRGPAAQLLAEAEPAALTAMTSYPVQVTAGALANVAQLEALRADFVAVQPPAVAAAAAPQAGGLAGAAGSVATAAGAAAVAAKPAVNSLLFLLSLPPLDAVAAASGSSKATTSAAAAQPFAAEVATVRGSALAALANASLGVPAVVDTIATAPGTLQLLLGLLPAATEAAGEAAVPSTAPGAIASPAAAAGGAANDAGAAAAAILPLEVASRAALLLARVSSHATLAPALAEAGPMVQLTALLHACCILRRRMAEGDAGTGAGAAASAASRAAAGGSGDKDGASLAKTSVPLQLAGVLESAWLLQPAASAAAVASQLATLIDGLVRTLAAAASLPAGTAAATTARPIPASGPAAAGPSGGGGSSALHRFVGSGGLAALAAALYDVLQDNAHRPYAISRAAGAPALASGGSKTSGPVSTLLRAAALGNACKIGITLATAATAAAPSGVSATASVTIASAAMPAVTASKLLSSGVVDALVEALRAAASASDADAHAVSARKNAAVALAKLSKDAACSARIRELRGIEILMAVSGSLVK